MKKFTLIWVILAMLFFNFPVTGVSADAIPVISFISPTTDNNTIINVNHTTINVSVNAQNETSSFINWDNSLVGYWNFNDGTAADKSTNNNNGTLMNGPQQVAGKFGSALFFDGVNDYIDLGGGAGSLPLNNYPTQQLTISTWIKLDSNFRSLGRIIGKVGTDVGLYVWSNRVIRGCIGNTSGTQVWTGGGAVLNTNQWYFVVMSYNGSQIKIFLNGVSDNLASQTGAIRGPRDAYQIGGYVYRCVTDYGNRFYGAIDEIQLWNRALSEQEIKALYNTQINALSSTFTNLENRTYNYYAYTTDTAGNSAQTETRTLIVNTSLPANNAPVSNNDTYNVIRGGTLSVTAPGVLSNDTDADSNNLTAIKVTDPTHGTLTLNINGSFNYVHDNSANTADTFTYKANDGMADSNIATATITINGINRAPVSNNDTYNVIRGGTLSVTAPGVLSNDTDADSNNLTAIKVTDPTHGTFTLNANGSFNYVHDNSTNTADTFTYKANDGMADSNVAAVTITIGTENTPPAAVTNLAAGNPTTTSLTLTWTAPGDDANSGTATQYDIRYSTSPINEIIWATAAQVAGEPTPLIAGTSQNCIVSGLSANTTYYFALKTVDEVSNWSSISNIATVTTTIQTKVEGIIIDHNCIDITQIPEWAIISAKNNLHIGYGHISHGAQLTYGMTGLVAFANGGGKGLSLPQNIFAWNNGGTGGALDLEEGSGQDLTGWLPYDVRDSRWATWTRTYLNDPGHSDVNVIMYAWCLYGGKAGEKYAAGTLQSQYLDPMYQLETDYPDVTFVYFTSPIDHSSSAADDANCKAANAMIRTYFNNDTHTNKALYDFGDIESYNPDGTYFEFTGGVDSSSCNYYNSASNTTPLGNWATAWQGTHTQNVDWYFSQSPHAEPLAANLKAYAAWWLFARIAGWDGTTGNQAPQLAAIGDRTINEGQLLEFTVSATDADGDTLTYSSSNLPQGALFNSATRTFSWTPTNSQAGVYPQICFTVSDGTLSDTENITITVNGVHYVSTEGSNNNAGTLSQPWRNITYAASHVQPGDTIYVRGGIYNEQVIIDSDGNADKWITFKNYPGETPIIDGSSLNLSLDGLVRIIGSNYIIFEGFQVNGSPNYGVYVLQSSHVIIRSCIVEQSNLFGIGLYEAVSVYFTGSYR